MRIKVRAFSDLKDVVGTALLELNIEGEESVQSALEQLRNKFGAEYKVATGRSFDEFIERANIFLNDKIVDREARTTTTFKEDDELLIAQPVAGG